VCEARLQPHRELIDERRRRTRRSDLLPHGHRLLSVVCLLLSK
jgi:hypothetical protein